jgi:hypothetical protein
MLRGAKNRLKPLISLGIEAVGAWGVLHKWTDTPYHR